MGTLRERQKADREKRILSAAVHKFRANGYKRVRIEDLAEAAEVSVGTVYNYYGTKGDILIAIVTMEVEEVLAEGQALVDNPPTDPGEALLALTFCYYDHSLNYLTKEMWRRAMALSIEAPDTPNGRRYATLDTKLAKQVGDLLCRFQQQGKLAPELDAPALGRVVFNNLNQSFIDFVTDDSMTLDNLRANVTALTTPIAQLLPKLT
ncbi:TetR/AcrR family transcriptional regulator [Roseobacter sp. YSTF-M11]|uniref:TetR/AcrR family transcriptional regulator n=1 Tax=Roseobacter insulae TaxID=2859783 RepID=A0A9X1K391_9RHOB|nr:TetR/AcrR family transcriptional regulator [Roseobacter insulae]MBW4708387.1 TetR/AcrR family transcriptional regulator [Roseobacter insulae]